MWIRAQQATALELEPGASQAQVRRQFRILVPRPPIPDPVTERLSRSALDEMVKAIGTD